MILHLATFAALVSFASAVTRGQSINSNIQKALDYRVNGVWSDIPELIAMYTGLYSTGSWSAPLTQPIVDTTQNPSFYSLTQQTLFTLQSAPGLQSRNKEIGYQSKAYVLYKLPGEQYAHRPSGTTNTCPTTLNSAGTLTGCRSIYRYLNQGLADNSSIAVVAQVYDPTTRPWYTAAAAKKKFCWSELYTFASTSFSQAVAGLSSTAPIYKSDGSLIGVASADISYDYITAVLIPYTEADTTSYLVETSTYYLIASTTSTNPAASSSLSKASASGNPTISTSATYLTTADTLWKADGTYTIDIEEVSSEVTVLTYTDASTTLMWKIVTVTPATGVVNYISPINRQANAVKDYLLTLLTYAHSISSHNAQLHNADSYAPLSSPIALKDPDMTGLSQQSQWILDRSFGQSFPGFLSSISAGYSGGTFMGYIALANVHYEFYRPPDTKDTSCAAITGYSAIAASCARVYTVDTATGVSTGTPIYQVAFDPRSRLWYTTAKNYSTGAFTSPYHSAFGNINLISVGVPLFYPDGTTLYGVTQTSMDLAYWTTLLADSTDASFTSYIVHKKTGYLVATNSGLSIYPFASAVSSSNSVISTSYSYLTTRGLSGDADVSTTYTDSSGSVYTMRIVNQLVVDSTTTITADVVFVSLTPITASPTLSPTTSVADDETSSASTSGDDDKLTIAKGASLASAILAGLLVVLVIVLIVLVVAGRGGGATQSSSSTTELTSTKNAMA